MRALLARVHAAQGRPEAGLALLEGAQGSPAGYDVEVALLQARAEVLAAAGRREESVAAARRLAELARERGARPMLARGLFLAGELEEAKTLAAELSMERLQARIEEAMGRRPGAA